jgi:hypothetical protein
MKAENLMIALLAALMVVGVYAGLYAVGIVVLVWAWNTLLAGVLGLPTISFMHGVALAILLGTLRSTLRVFTHKEVKSDES